MQRCQDENEQLEPRMREGTLQVREDGRLGYSLSAQQLPVEASKVAGRVRETLSCVRTGDPRSSVARISRTVVPRHPVSTDTGRARPAVVEDFLAARSRSFPSHCARSCVAEAAFLIPLIHRFSRRCFPRACGNLLRQAADIDSPGRSSHTLYMWC